MRPVAVLCAACAALSGGCGGGGPGAAAGDTPIAHECGEAEAAVPGGGCLPVGPPRGCWPGWLPDGDGGCEPILPAIDDGDRDDAGCPAGTMPAIGQDECRPVGLPQDCRPGWLPDSDGGCEPIFPADWRDCPAGALPALGSAACPPPPSCDLPADLPEDAVYADAAYAGQDADGSAARPYPTVQAAADAAPDGGIVLVAPGDYVEDLTLDRPLRILGACAQRVVLRGSDRASARALRISGADARVHVRGVTVSGLGGGVLVARQADATLEDVVVRDAGGPGVEVRDGAQLALRRALVAGNRDAGVSVVAATAAVEETVVADTRPRAADGLAGIGVAAQSGPIGGESAALALRRSLVEGNRGFGVLLFGSTATIEETVVRDTRPQRADGRYGSGIEAHADPAHGVRSLLTVRRSLIADNQSAGVLASGSSATLHETEVRGTLPPAGGLAYGVLVIGEQPDGPPADLRAVRSRVAGNTGYGVVGADATLVLFATEVRGTDAAPTRPRQSGAGLVATGGREGGRSQLAVRGCLIAGNHNHGLLLFDADAAIEDTTVRDTLQGAPGGAMERKEEDWSAGIAIVRRLGAAPPRVDLARCLVAGSTQAGLLAQGARATVLESWVDGTRPLPGLRGVGRGIEAQGDPAEPVDARVDVRRCRVTGSQDAGIYAFRSTVSVRETTVRGTAARDDGAQFGDGLIASGEGEAATALHASASLIEGNARAGALFLGAGGSLAASILRGNRFAVAIESGAAPTIGEDNLLSPNARDGVTVGKQLAPAPPLRPLSLPELSY